MRCCSLFRHGQGYGCAAFFSSKDGAVDLRVICVPVFFLTGLSWSLRVVGRFIEAWNDFYITFLRPSTAVVCVPCLASSAMCK